MTVSLVLSSFSTNIYRRKGKAKPWKLPRVLLPMRQVVLMSSTIQVLQSFDPMSTETIITRCSCVVRLLRRGTRKMENNLIPRDSFGLCGKCMFAFSISHSWFEILMGLYRQQCHFE